MRRLPLGFEPFKMLAHLLAALAHHAVEPLELGDLAGHGVEGEAVPIQHLGKGRVGGDDGGAEGADRALLPKQRRGVQRPPLPGCPYAGAELEVDMPVRVTRPAGAVRHRDGLQLLDGYDFLLSARPHSGHGVLSEPSLNLAHSVLLRQVESIGDFGVERGGDRQRLRGVHDHLREPRRAPPPLARQARPAHRLTSERVHPVHPARIGLRVEPQGGGHVPVAAECSELRHGRVSAEVVVIGAGAVGLDIAARIGPGSPEQDHAAMHKAHYLDSLLRQLWYLPR